MRTQGDAPDLPGKTEAVMTVLRDYQTQGYMVGFAVCIACGACSALVVEQRHWIRKTKIKCSGCGARYSLFDELPKVALRL